MKPIFILAHLLFVAALWGQGRIHVDGSALGANDGSSWADALTDLHAALAAAQPGDEVWVARGTYLPTPGTDRDSFFNLPSGVRLYGGFAGTETDLSQRDWAAHPSTMSGDIGIAGDSTDNSYTILYMDNPDSLTVVDGFRFEWGNANLIIPGESASGPRRCGGALYIMGADGEAYPTILNCHFGHNTARFGGAVFVNGTNNGSVAPVFLNCVFERNTAEDGGGVYRKGGSWAERTPDFGGCSFLDNYCGRWGGGLFFEDAETTDTLQVWDSKFIGNTKGLGAAMFMSVGRQDGSKVDVQRCDFRSNSGSYGAVFNISNIFSFSNTDFVRIEGSNISDNYGFLEGMIFVHGFGATDSSRTVINNCVFSDNKKTSMGGIFLLNLDMSDKGSVSITNTKILDNKVGPLMTIFSAGKQSLSHCLVVNNETFGGGFLSARNNPNVEVSNSVFLKNKITDADVAAISLRYAKITIRNSIFERKTIFSQELPSNQLLSEIKIFNSVLSFEKLIADGGNPGLITTSISHALLNTALFDCANPPPGVTCGPGNLFNLDPLFRDTANGDYSLLPCSPLINAGSNDAVAGIATDLAGAPRIQGGTVDIGAYEQVGLALSALPQAQPSCLGATNGSIAIALEDGGCGPYSYAWSPDAGNGPEIDGLPPGAYMFTVTDGSGRQISDTVIVEALPQPELSLAAQDIACGTHAGGTLSATVTGGTAPFGYGWSAGLGDLPQHAGLGPGPYALTVSDANGCLDSASATLALVGNLTLSVGAVPISCHGEADAELTVQPANGVPPFDWQWQGWPGNAPTAAPLGPGLYAVTVTDALGCTAAFSFNPVTAPAPLVLGAEGSPQTQSSPPNGAAVVTTTSGGTQPYGYLWDMGETGHAIGGLAAGTYTVTVTDARGCTATAEVVVELMLSATGEPLGVVLFYPNPAVDWVRALLPESRSAGWRLEVSDASGRVVRSSGCADSDCVLDLSGLASGAYVLTARSGERVLVGRVVKQ